MIWCRWSARSAVAPWQGIAALPFSRVSSISLFVQQLILVASLKSGKLNVATALPPESCLNVILLLQSSFLRYTVWAAFPRPIHQSIRTLNTESWQAPRGGWALSPGPKRARPGSGGIATFQAGICTAWKPACSITAASSRFSQGPSRSLRASPYIIAGLLVAG